MTRGIASTVRWLVAALGLPLAACALEAALWGVIAPYAWILFYPAAFWAPIVGGAGSGLVATLVSGGLAFGVFVPGRGTGEWVSLGVFLMLGGTFSWFHDRTTRAQLAASARQKEREQQQAQLLAQYELVQAAVECIPDPFWIYDASDRLSIFNAAYVDLARCLGVEVAAGMSFKDIFPVAFAHLVFESPEERLAFREARLAARSQGTADSYDFNLRDGRQFRVGRRVLPDGSVVHVGFERTAERQHERALEDARLSAEGANRAKTEFLTSMSHELRTPMNAVLGFAQLMQRDTKTPLSPKHLNMIDHVLESGQHLLSLIDEVLDLARIESQSVDLTIEPVDLDDAIAKTVATLKPVAERAEIELLAPLARSKTVLADRRRLHQLLLNLASNAVKYNHPGGRVTLTTDVSEASVRISVIDNGMGVPEAARHKLFQPFQRAGRETGNITGTGIGLTITLRIAELMGGRVGYEPLEPGSLFWVELPLAAEHQAAAGQLSSGKVPVAAARLRGRLLYVDDNLPNLDLLQSYVAAQPGLTLSGVTTAEEGLERAARDRPDVLLIDINLPGLNGLEALARFRKLPGMSHTPAVAISASAFAQDRAQAKLAGFEAYLSKPLALEELDRVLARLLDKPPAPALPRVVHGAAQSE